MNEDGVSFSPSRDVEMLAPLPRRAAVARTWRDRARDAAVIGAWCAGIVVLVFVEWARFRSGMGR